MIINKIIKEEINKKRAKRIYHNYIYNKLSDEKIKHVQIRLKKNVNKNIFIN